MNINDELKVKVEKISNLGTGIARVDGFVIFIENACPEDELKIKITKVPRSQPDLGFPRPAAWCPRTERNMKSQSRRWTWKGHWPPWRYKTPSSGTAHRWR